MDKIYEQTMLFDFYGELLTEHQRSIYEDAVYNDLSLSEIAQERGISRQGVHDSRLPSKYYENSGVFACPHKKLRPSGAFFIEKNFEVCYNNSTS